MTQENKPCDKIPLGIGAAFLFQEPQGNQAQERKKPRQFCISVCQVTPLEISELELKAFTSKQKYIQATSTAGKTSRHLGRIPVAGSLQSPMGHHGSSGICGSAGVWSG